MVIGTYEIFVAIYKPGATKNTDYTGTPFRGSYSRMLDNDTTSIHLHSLLLSSDASKEAMRLSIILVKLLLISSLLKILVGFHSSIMLIL